MPLLLMVFLTVVCLPDPSDWPQPIWAKFWPELGIPQFSVALTLVALAAPVLYAWGLSRRVAHALRSHVNNRLAASQRYERGRRRHQLLLFCCYGVALLSLGWGRCVLELWQVHGRLLPGAELMILAPFLIALVLSWCCFYDADRASYQAAHRMAGLDGLGHAFLESDDVAIAVASPAREFGGRLAYVAQQFRQKLALVCIPIVLLLTEKELQRQLPEFWQGWQWLASLAGIVLVLAVFAMMPWIIRAVLRLRPLPAGPLSDRLHAAARRLHFRCSDILVWNTNGSMANAMVVGVLPWLRYVVFTDRLLEEFAPEEVEAVLGHEIGHVKHHHMLYYLVFLLGSMMALGMLVTEHMPELMDTATAALAGNGPGWRSLVDLLSDHKYLQWTPLIASLLAYIVFVFGFVSRRCERQADIFGCRAVSCADRACPGHDGTTELSGRGRSLCSTGIRTFIHALEKVAFVNGISRDKPGFLQSWQHSTIGRRIEFLQRMLADPALEPRFQRRVAVLKWGLFAALIAVFAVLV